LAAVEHLQAQMVQIQFLDQSHQLVVEALLAVDRQVAILVALVVVEAGVQLDLPGRVALELPIKDIKAVMEELITQHIVLVVAVVERVQRRLMLFQLLQPQVVLA
jgi:hypothetical protein